MSILRIARWEWFKLQRQRVPWVLLAILFAFSQLAIWGGYASYTINSATGGRVILPPGVANTGKPRVVTCRQLQESPDELLPADAPPMLVAGLQQQCVAEKATLALRYQALSPAGSVTSTLGVASVLGLILLAVLTAIVVGSEFGLGTLRPILARGAGRLQFVAGKYLMLVGVTTATLLVVCSIAAGSGALAFRAATPPADGVLPALVTFATVAPSFAKTWGALLAFVTMTASITLLVRSTAAGMAISLGFYIVEGVLIRLLSNAFDWFEAVADFMPMRNISALTSSRSGIAAMLGGGSDIGTLHSCLVLAAWAIGFAVIAAWVFRRRDITGAAGG